MTDDHADSTRPAPYSSQTGHIPRSAQTTRAAQKIGLTGLVLAGLALLAAGGPLGTDMFLPSVPDITRALGTADASTQLAIAAFMLGMGVGQVILGPLSDATGRKKLLVGGMVLGIFASILCAVAPTIAVLIAARFLQGIAGGSGVVLARAIISDRASGEEAARGYAVMMTIICVAPVLAPLIGSVIAEVFDWRAIFWTLAIIAVAQVVVALSLPESLPPEARSTQGPVRTYGNMVTLLRSRVFAGYTLSFAFGCGTMFSFISASSVMYQEQLGLEPMVFSVMFAINAAALIVTNLVNVRFVGRFGPRKLQTTGVVFLVVGAGLSVATALFGLPVYSGDGVVVPSWFVVLVAAGTFIATCGSGLCMSNSTALGQSFAPRSAGAASAVLGAAQYLVAGTVSPLVAVGSNNLLTMAVMMLGCSLLALLGVVLSSPAHSGR